MDIHQNYLHSYGENIFCFQFWLKWGMKIEYERMHWQAKGLWREWYLYVTFDNVKRCDAGVSGATAEASTNGASSIERRRKHLYISILSRRMNGETRSLHLLLLRRGRGIEIARNQRMATQGVWIRGSHQKEWNNDRDQWHCLMFWFEGIKLSY